MLFEDEMDLEIHWVKNEWPTIMINCDAMIKSPYNIRLTFLKSHTNLSGSFNCGIWKNQVHFESNDKYFKDP